MPERARREKVREDLTKYQSQSNEAMQRSPEDVREFYKEFKEGIVVAQNGGRKPG